MAAISFYDRIHPLSMLRFTLERSLLTSSHLTMILPFLLFLLLVTQAYTEEDHATLETNKSEVVYFHLHMLDCRLDSKSLIFFVKKSYLGPRWWHFRNFWPSWSWPIILSYHDSFGSHFHPLHVPIWPNESKTSIWACPDFWYLYK